MTSRNPCRIGLTPARRAPWRAAVLFISCFACAAWASPAPAHAQRPPRSRVIYVDAAAAGAATGASWDDAFPNLADALAAAASGDEIWIAQGVYKPAGPAGDRNASFRVAPGVTLRGGFAGGESAADQADPQSHPTSISGDLNADDAAQFVNRTDNTRKLLIIEGPVADPARPTLLDGLFLERAFANETIGGCVTLAAGDLALRRCTIRENAARHGAGLWAAAGTRVEMTDCLVTSNQAGRGLPNSGYGGGVYLAAGAGPVVDIGALEAASSPPGPCLADYNADGCHDALDYDMFVDDFVRYFDSGEGFPDANADGVVDAFDYDDFVSALRSGC